MNATDPTLPDRLRAALELLESVATDTHRCSTSSTPEPSASACTRPSRASTTPIPSIRRQKLKAARARAQRGEASAAPTTLLDQTGIRTLRRRAGVHHAELFPAASSSGSSNPVRTLNPTPRPSRSESLEPQALLRLQAEVYSGASLLRPDVPGVRGSSIS